MDPDSDSSGEETSVERSTVLPTELEPKDLYILRPFPTLIGSATFYETDHLGLRLEDSSASEDGSESEGESSGTETEVRMRVKPGARGGLAEDIDGSSGDLFSEDEVRVSTNNAVREENGSPVTEGTGLLHSKKERGKFSRTNHTHSSDEGNLFGSSSDEDLFSEAQKREKKEVKQIEKQVSEETAEIIPTATASKDQGKKKIRKKLPAGGVPVFGILDSDGSDDDSGGDSKTADFTQSSRSAVSGTSGTKNFGFFDEDSDSEGDLFSSDKPKQKSKAETAKSIKENKVASEPDASKPVDTLFGGSKIKFDSGSDEDLFEASTTSKNTVKSDNRIAAKKPIGGVQLFSGLDQTAILGFKTNQPSNKEETSSPTIPVESVAKSNATKLPGKDKGVSLYDNSSSDDDLFNSMSQATEPSKSNRSEQTDKLQQGGKSTPVQTNASPKPPSSNQLDLFNSSGEDSGDDLFSKPASAKRTPALDTVAPSTVKTDSPVPEAKPPPEPVTKDTSSEVKPVSEKSPFTDKDTKLSSKPKENRNKPPRGLFQVDSDSDDDLFSIIASKPIKTETKSVPSDPVPSRGVVVSDLFSENDELFSVIQSTPDSSIVPNSNLPDKSRPVPALFSATEQEDEDLLDAPASLNLFVTPSPFSNGAQAPKPKPKPATLFSPIVTNTGTEGGLFDQASPPPTNYPIDTRPQQTLLPSLTVSRPKNPGRRPPSQKTRQQRAENATMDALLAPPQGADSVTETAETQTHKPNKLLSGAGKNADFMKELNKAMGKGMAPGESVLKKKPSQTPSLFQQEGDLFSNTGPRDRPKGAERGPAPTDGLYTPEEPSKLVGVTKNRPKPPGKRLPNRKARTSNIPHSTEEFGNFYSEPLVGPTFNANKSQRGLFNGSLENDLFALPSSTYVAGKSKFHASIPAGEDDTFQIGDFHEPLKQRENNIEDVLFPDNREPPVSKLKDETIPVLPVANKRHDANLPAQDLPEDLFASVALPKPTKSSRTATKERKNVSTPVMDREDPLNSKPTDPLIIEGNKDEAIEVEETTVPVDKPKKHKVIKQSDNDLFGGEDPLFGAISESNHKPKGDRARKKRATDANKKSQKPKKEVVDDLFD